MEYKLYHYNIDNFNDMGFGCSYRNLQTILSSFRHYYDNNIKIPDIKDLLYYFKPNYKHLIEIDNLNELWIEPYQISQYLQDYNINALNLLYLFNDDDINKVIKTDIDVYDKRTYYKENFNSLLNIINYHFLCSKLPIVIDDGVYSYCICKKNNDYLLISDPHIMTGDNMYEKPLSFLSDKTWMIYIPVNYSELL